MNFSKPDGKVYSKSRARTKENKDREELIGIINEFDGKGLDCVILACTDLQLLIPDHKDLKIFDNDEDLCRRDR